MNFEKKIKQKGVMNMDIIDIAVAVKMSNKNIENITDNIQHNNLKNIQGGTDALLQIDKEYYHLSKSDYDKIVNQDIVTKEWFVNTLAVDADDNKIAIDYKFDTFSQLTTIPPAELKVGKMAEISTTENGQWWNVSKTTRLKGLYSYNGTEWIRPNFTQIPLYDTVINGDTEETTEKRSWTPKVLKDFIDGITNVKLDNKIDKIIPIGGADGIIPIVMNDGSLKDIRHRFDDTINDPYRGLVWDSVQSADYTDNKIKEIGTDINNELINKVDKVTGESLIADTEKTRLQGMATNATKVEDSIINGNIKINGVEDVVYTLPNNIETITGSQSKVDTAITSIKGGVATDGDNLNKLRNLISGIQTLLNSNDVNLDSLVEIVDFIKNNKSLIDGITINKINYTDIIDTLTSIEVKKVLSANQGKVLKGFIDALTSSLSTHTTNMNNPHNTTKSHIGLGNADNTSDANKPISTPQQNAFNLKQNITDNTLTTIAKTIPTSINELDRNVKNILLDFVINSNPFNGASNCTQSDLQSWYDSNKSKSKHKSISTSNPLSLYPNLPIISTGKYALWLGENEWYFALGNGTNSGWGSMNNFVKGNFGAQIDQIALESTTVDFKVDKVTGKSLVLDTEITKLSTIQNGAEVNVQSDWSISDTNSDSYIRNKPTIPVIDVTKSYVDQKDLLKVDKVTGKSLIDDVKITKLDTIQTNAEVNVQSDWNITDTSSDSFIKNKPTIPTGVTVIDNLTDSIKTNALSSNQGRILNNTKVSKGASLTSYFVDTVNGDDNNSGTQALPYKTMVKALSTISNGVMGGTTKILITPNSDTGSFAISDSFCNLEITGTEVYGGTWNCSGFVEIINCGNVLIRGMKSIGTGTISIKNTSLVNIDNFTSISTHTHSIAVVKSKAVITNATISNKSGGAIGVYSGSDVSVSGTFTETNNAWTVQLHGGSCLRQLVNMNRVFKESNSYILIPDKLGDLSVDDTKTGTDTTTNNAIWTANKVKTVSDTKVDKVTGKSLIDDTRITKLDGIAIGAEVNVQSDWNTTVTTDDSFIKNKPDLALKQNITDNTLTTNGKTIPIAINELDGMVRKNINYAVYKNSPFGTNSSITQAQIQAWYDTNKTINVKSPDINSPLLTYTNLPVVASGGYAMWLGDSKWYYKLGNGTIDCWKDMSVYSSGKGEFQSQIGCIALGYNVIESKADKSYVDAQDNEILGYLVKKAEINDTTVSSGMTYSSSKIENDKNIVNNSIGTKVDKTTTVNGRALSSNITITSTDIGLGTVNNTSDSTKNVLSATKLTTPRTINGYPFDGTQNVTIPIPSVDVNKAYVDAQVATKGNKSTGSMEYNGWHKCGDTGMIQQWGRVATASGTGQVTVDFPIPFPNVCMMVTATVNSGNSSGNGLDGCYVAIASNSQFLLTHDYTSTNNSNQHFWFAIGR